MGCAHLPGDDAGQGLTVHEKGDSSLGEDGPADTGRLSSSSAGAVV